MTLVLQKFRVILGMALCVVGLAGTLVPIIPGAPLVVAGLALMGTDHPLVRGLKARLTGWRKSQRSS